MRMLLGQPFWKFAYQRFFFPSFISSLIKNILSRIEFQTHGVMFQLNCILIRVKRDFWCAFISFQIVKNHWKMFQPMCMNQYVGLRYPTFWAINEQHRIHRITQTTNRFHP